MNNYTIVAIDLAKTVFEVAVSNRPGAILMEACGSAHSWGRLFERIGPQVLLLPPHDVATYRKGQKTDRADAKALLKAHWNEEILPVAIKSPDQQALTSLDRLRSCWTASSAAGLNTIHGLLREFGLPIPVGAKRVVPRVTVSFDDDPVRLTFAITCSGGAKRNR